ncbi:MAG: hypothetical protein D6744_11905 [Planctomycetota bacterium]|nr:MAG: hypothetical protein D6744_11905 [Planctomycetota bacterium]
MAAATGSYGDSPPVVGIGELRYQPTPELFVVAQIGGAIDSAAISDIESGEFTGDGFPDIAVAWYATDLISPATRQRFLTIFAATPDGSLERHSDFNLYVYNSAADSLSIFRNGTSEIGSGDFDGDGDVDLAVASYFGDEIWFFENFGNGQFGPHLKFMYGSINSSGNFTTPPEAVSADFDGDGRDELAYVADVNQRIDGRMVQFWETQSSISQMQRTSWDVGVGAMNVRWTRSLAAGDFDGDGAVDLAITGSYDPTFETDPALVIWHAFDPVTQRFVEENYAPDYICADVVALPAPDQPCVDNLVIGDLARGDELEEWLNDCGDPLDFDVDDSLPTLNGATSGDRGAALAFADVNDDGTFDIIARHRIGDPGNDRQIQIVLRDPTTLEWERASPNQLDTSGLENSAADPQLRPRNLVVADLFGNSRPEIVAAFNPTFVNGQTNGDLVMAVWNNGCVADLNQDGEVGLSDLSLMMQSFGCGPDPWFADLTRDGCVDIEDLSILLNMFDCGQAGARQGPTTPAAVVEDHPRRQHRP